VGKNSRYEFNYERLNLKAKIGTYRDEPYYYHSKLLEVLTYTSIGKEGLF